MQMIHAVKRPFASLRTSLSKCCTTSFSTSASSSPLEKWSDSLTDEQMDKLLDELIQAGKLSKHNTANENRALQQNMLRQLAGQGLLRDNATGWSADAETGGGHFFMNGTSPITTGWDGIDQDLDIVRFPGFDEKHDAAVDADGDGDEYLSLLFVDATKEERNTQGITNTKTKVVHSYRDEDVLAPNADIEASDLLSLPDVYQSANGLSMWSFLHQAKNIEKTVESFTDVIAALFHHGDWRRARDLFDSMELEALDNPELTPSLETYNAVLKGLFTTISEQNIDEAIRVFDSMPSMGYERDAGTYEAVIEGLVHHGRVTEALDLFDVLHKGTNEALGEEAVDHFDEDEPTHDEEISGISGGVDTLLENDDFAAVLEEFDQEARHSEQVDSAISAEAMQAEEDEEFFAEYSQGGALLTTRSYNIVLGALGKQGETNGLNQSWMIFEEMGDRCARDTETYNNMMRNLFLAKDVKKATTLFNTMPDIGAQHDSSTNDVPLKNQRSYDVVLDGYASFGMVDEIKELFDEMTVEKGLKKNTWPFMKSVRQEGAEKPFYQKKMARAW
jgi:pentatricopeptide repeat protein